MIHIRRVSLRLQIWCAIHLGSIGDYWAASAARRLGELSGEPSANGPGGER